MSVSSVYTTGTYSHQTYILSQYSYIGKIYIISLKFLKIILFLVETPLESVLIFNQITVWTILVIIFLTKLRSSATWYTTYSLELLPFPYNLYEITQIGLLRKRNKNMRERFITINQKPISVNSLTKSSYKKGGLWARPQTKTGLVRRSVQVSSLVIYNVPKLRISVTLAQQSN